MFSDLLDRGMAAIYDRTLAPSEVRGLAAIRAELLGDLTGDVLAIGEGTGLNLPHYPVDLRSLTLTEPTAAMRVKLEARLHDLGRVAHIVNAPAERLPFGDHSFDHVVSTLVLCTVDDPVAALAEVARVLRPGGSLRLVEHVAADGGRTEVAQKALRPIWKVVARGCDLHRDTRALLEAAGFDTTHVVDSHLPGGVSIVRRTIQGTATVS